MKEGKSLLENQIIQSEIDKWNKKLINETNGRFSKYETTKPGGGDSDGSGTCL